MRLIAALYVLSTLLARAAHAEQVFSCDGAEVRIEVVAHESPTWEDRAQAVFTVSRGREKTVLRYQNIDFIGGQCVVKDKAQSLVIFQAYCGGSGCKDRDNWGVIDPRTLRVLTVPSVTNREEAKKILGDTALPTLPLLSIFTEARKQGIKVPD
ncbi:hypothetical protein ACFFKC_17625 [Pseudoduganella danionis]|uniref:Uncharacterized protein n=1 Tax=Pseudoduganella danionis TaxID=1890295 RepID=A0ABW9SQ21_9BURK|nr:hypothetical protein [Pseudoduganella danionis]MTW33709.1 hypothetical protein [Pseudoduganella danionis]